MVYNVPANYPPLYHTSKMKETHAVAFGATLGAKYYYGNTKENVWAQELDKKAKNTQGDERL